MKSNNNDVIYITEPQSVVEISAPMAYVKITGPSCVVDVTGMPENAKAECYRELLGHLRGALNCLRTIYESE